MVYLLLPELMVFTETSDGVLTAARAVQCLDGFLHLGQPTPVNIQRLKHSKISYYLMLIF